MMTTNKTVLNKCKTASRNAFIKIGNAAAGNTDGNKRGNVPFEPFSFAWIWVYETKAPKRKRP